MKIERLEEIRLTPQDDLDIADLLARCFDTNFGRRSYYQQRHHIRFVAREDCAIVGHMALCFRDVRLGSDLVPIVGLAEVATDPAHRGKGMASALLTAAVAEAEASLARFFVLFGDRPMYAARGFVSVSNQATYLELDGARTGTVKTGTGTGDGLMVLGLGRGTWDERAPLDLLGHKF